MNVYKFKNTGNSTVIVIVVLATVMLLGWYSLTSTKNNELETVSTEASQQLDAASTKFLESLNELNSIVLDTTVFQSPAYSQLKDFSRPIMPEPQGRANPFADINTDTGSEQDSNASMGDLGDIAGSSINSDLDNTDFGSLESELGNLDANF